MGWLGLDDTDSLAGGCTTEVFDTLLRHLPAGASTGVPRLVRLWPFARRRTRGNAALAVEIRTVDTEGLLAHLDAWWNDHLAPLDGGVEASSMSDRDQYPASPGMVWFEQATPPSVYVDAVRSRVAIEGLPEPTRLGGTRSDWSDSGCGVARVELHVGSHRLATSWGRRPAAPCG